MKLIRSKDRKVTNKVTPNGKQAKIANTFGLPAGKAFSCPGETSVCRKICYAGKLEKIFPGVLSVLVENWKLLKDADFDTMVSLLQSMIDDFRKDCEKHDAEKLFRIHWDGDFFNEIYTLAWAYVIKSNTDIDFWVYTRVASAVDILHSIDNLSLYFSTDTENQEIGFQLKKKYSRLKLAVLTQDFDSGLELCKANNIKAVKCPENNKKIPLISQKGSACVSCKLCVDNKNNVLFSISKK
jgi:hypothetical protein